MSDDDGKRERRVSQTAIIDQVRENKAAIARLEERLENLESTLSRLEKILKPVAEFYTLVRSDFDTLGRFGRGLRGLLAWGAALILSAGVIVAWAKNGFKFPGG